MPAPKDVCYWRGRVGGLIRDRDIEDPELIEARRNLAEANILHYIQRVLATAPPLSDEQLSRLRNLLHPNTRQCARDALDDRERNNNVSHAAARTPKPTGCESRGNARYKSP